MKFFILKILFLFTFVFVNAQQNAPVVEFAMSGGYASADLRWSIAGNENGPSPNILSEVKWHALSGPVIDFSGRLNLTKRLFVGGAFAKCFIKTGNATDTDYGADDRQQPVYHAQLDSDEGYLTTVRLYGGYNFLLRSKIRLAVFAGYAANKESLFLLDHTAYVPGQKNLRCTYSTNWKGILGGLSGLYQVTPWLDVMGGLQYSQMNYNALADWNLIDAFQHPVSFQHRARGFDLQMSLTGAVRLNRYLSLFVSGTYRHAETGTGTDELYLESGTVQTSQFNGAGMHAKKLIIGTLIRL